MSPLFGCAYAGVQVVAGVAILNVNDANGSTRALVAYDSEDEPVRISYVGRPRRGIWLGNNRLDSGLRPKARRRR